MCAPMSCARCMVCCGRKGLLLGRKRRERLLPNAEQTEQTSPFECRADGTDVSLSITAEEKAFGTELTISLRRPCDGMSKQKVARSMQEMLDQIVRHLEHILMTEGTDDAKAK